MAMILHSDALTLPCSATFADAQAFVHHHAMTAVNGKTTFFKGFLARFVGENATITCFEVKDNRYAFNPVMGCGQLSKLQVKSRGDIGKWLKIFMLPPSF